MGTSADGESAVFVRRLSSNWRIIFSTKTDAEGIEGDFLGLGVFKRIFGGRSQRAGHEMSW